MASMVHWAKQQGLDQRTVLESRGDTRRQYLLHFLVHSSREKKSRVESKVMRVVGQTTEIRSDKVGVLSKRSQ